jgi:CubicO group peptidase (beta-lactamase class C family)
VRAVTDLDDAPHPTDPTPEQPTVDPADAGFDPAALDVLRDKIRRQVDEGRMPACSFAFAVEGEVVVHEHFGDAAPHTRFTVFSATKALVGAVVWQLIGEGRLATDTRVIELVPGFGQAGRTPEWMAQVTIEQLLTHTSGFPYAPLNHPTWADRDARLEVFSRWHATSEPGSMFTYHPTSAHWVLAEVIRVVDEQDHRDSVRERIIEPLGLSTFTLGTPVDHQDGIATLELAGEPATKEELVALFGEFDTSLLDVVTPAALLEFNRPEVREVGVPGAGGVGTAVDLVRFYQALLHDPQGLWDPDVLADATGRIRCTMPNPMTGVASNRSLGLVIAGDDGLGAFRGMGPTVSPATFGHNGAAGQIAWADPANGVSFALVTSGIDQHYLREARRIVSLASAAGVCRPVSA